MRKPPKIPEPIRPATPATRASFVRGGANPFAAAFARPGAGQFARASTTGQRTLIGGST